MTTGLAYECNDKGVLIQCVCPGAVFTDMLTKIIGKKDLPNPSIFAPTPETFAKQALNTLGFSSYRTGAYWFHALLIKSGMLEYTGLAKKNGLKHLEAYGKQDWSTIWNMINICKTNLIIFSNKKQLMNLK